MKRDKIKEIIKEVEEEGKGVPWMRVYTAEKGFSYPIIQKPEYVHWKGKYIDISELPKGGYKRKFLTAKGRFDKLREKYRALENLPEVMSFDKDKWEILSNTEEGITIKLKEAKGEEEKLREMAGKLREVFKKLKEESSKKKLEEV